MTQISCGIYLQAITRGSTPMPTGPGWNFIGIITAQKILQLKLNLNFVNVLQDKNPLIKNRCSNVECTYVLFINTSFEKTFIFFNSTQKYKWIRPTSVEFTSFALEMREKKT